MLPKVQFPDLQSSKTTRIGSSDEQFRAKALPEHLSRHHPAQLQHVGLHPVQKLSVQHRIPRYL